MKTMKIEKQLMFADTVKNLVDLNVKDGLQYQHEADGIRALGPLFITGQFTNQEGAKQDFQEVLDMDILAPEHKLNNHEKFFITIEEFRGAPDHDGLHVYVTMSIHGLKEEQPKAPVADHMTEMKPIQQQPMKPIQQQPVIPEPETLISPENTPAVSPMPINTETEKDIDESVEASAEVDSIGEFEDLFEDADTTYTSYRMIVAKPDDSYDSIAQRYQIEANELREANRNKEIQAKTLVILP